MKRLFLIMLLVIGCWSSNAVAVNVGSCVRDGDSVVCNLGCRAFSMAKFNEMWPQGVFTLGELGVIAASSQRDLTAEEVALCTGEAVPVPMWRVAKNSTSTTRPYYALQPDGTKKKAGDIPVNTECDQSTDGYHVQLYTDTAWRRIIIEGASYVVVCSFK
jgi:hypothetical protein